jgi:hypothetical protein
VAYNYGLVLGYLGIKRVDDEVASLPSEELEVGKKT